MDLFSFNVVHVKHVRFTSLQTVALQANVISLQVTASKLTRRLTP